MTVHDEIEQIRRELNIPDFMMCNIFNITEERYRHYLAYKGKPTTYQIIRFICDTQRPLNSLSEEQNDT